MQPLAPQQKPSPANCGPTLLVIEDEPDLAALLYENLTQLPARVSTANDGERGLALALSKSWDLIVLDLRMPRLGGLDVCREIRSSGLRVPILILTARGTELDRVLGLEIGADDYMTKPFSMIELQARIKALLRRANQFASSTALAPIAASQPLVVGALRLDQDQRRASLAGARLELTPREWDLLWFFAINPGRAFSRAQLLEQVWGYSHDGYDHTVNSHINRLRVKLGDGRAGCSYIHTVWGTGYRFEMPA